MPNSNGGRPEEFEFTIEIDDFYAAVFGISLDDDIELAIEGKSKVINKGNGDTISISPQTKGVMTNLDTGESKELVLTGAFHDTVLDDGTSVTVATGLNILGDPLIQDGEGAIVQTRGRFTFAFDSDDNLIEPLNGNGQVIFIVDELL